MKCLFLLFAVCFIAPVSTSPTHMVNVPPAPSAIEAKNVNSEYVKRSVEEPQNITTETTVTALNSTNAENDTLIRNQRSIGKTTDEKIVRTYYRTDGTVVKEEHTISKSDGGALLMAPTFIDSVIDNEIKLINALKNQRPANYYQNRCEKYGKKYSPKYGCY